MCPTIDRPGGRGVILRKESESEYKTLSVRNDVVIRSGVPIRRSVPIRSGVPVRSSFPVSFPVQITPGFCLLLAWFAAVNGWSTLLLVLGAAAVHEAGHLLALSHCGGTRREQRDRSNNVREMKPRQDIVRKAGQRRGNAREDGQRRGNAREDGQRRGNAREDGQRGIVRGLRISVQGAALDIAASRLSYGRELLCVLAGPAANILLALLAARLAWEALAGASLLLGLYNLLPVRPLDGGRTVELAVSRVLGPRAGEQAARFCGAVFGLLLAAGAVWLMVHSGGTLWLLPPLAGFLSSALREARGQRETPFFC